MTGLIHRTNWERNNFAFKINCKKCLQVFDRFCDDVYILSVILLSYNKPKSFSVEDFKGIVQETDFTILYIWMKWKGTNLC